MTAAKSEPASYNTFWRSKGVVKDQPSRRCNGARSIAMIYSGQIVFHGATEAAYEVQSEVQCVVTTLRMAASTSSWR
jgi:hypothetical protein